MRLVKEISHTRYLIQVHEYNSKYLLKITLDAYEQIFKFEKDDLVDINLLDNFLTDEFFANCLTRFISMRNDRINFKID